MTQIDEFESLFKSAAKPIFQMEPIYIGKALIILDGGAQKDSNFVADIKKFLAVLNSIEHQVEIHLLDESEFESVNGLLETIRDLAPDIVCTYRNLRIPAAEYPYSLGVFVDVITQATSIPVLLFPRPEQATEQNLDLTHPQKVMAITDHLAGDTRLVSYAAKFTEKDGTLFLAHIEDIRTFEHYITTISKIPEIDTDVARETIMKQLLKEPNDYIETCRQGIREAGLPMEVEAVVVVGHHLSDYRNLIREHGVNLLVMHTKDDDQLAMHGLAYPLSVELREVPMLLI